jgi:hypothetical protein
MLQMNMVVGRLKLCLVAFVFCAVMPTVVLANSIKEHEANQAQDPGKEKPYQIKNRSQFACAEIATGQKTGSLSHEINLTPNKIERCDLVKVGSRLHGCKKYRFKQPTIDESGVVSIDTEDGPLQFWLNQNATVTSAEESKITEGGEEGTLMFLWPDEHKNYFCIAME